jgi:hypothetical protein
LGGGWSGIIERKYSASFSKRSLRNIGEYKINGNGGTTVLEKFKMKHLDREQKNI